MRRAFAGLAIAALAACQSMGDAEAPRATASLQPTQGNKTFGEATFEQVGADRVRVVVFAQNLKPGGEHGFHIHEAGDCSAPDAESAKGHFNPANRPHGMPGRQSHAGDLPMLKAAKNGRAKLDHVLEGVTLAAGPTSIVGRGIVIHADPDDFKSQPAGNSGARIACGVIRPG
ncbi:MAG TPA: superoxide dismutase family protein [Burkholderiales bacterium]|nr:superoxide dismutase family protein [Burkholderiales bacterium]